MLLQGTEDMTATQLRDVLLATDPLNQQWVIQVNQAEAEFWKRNSGYRVGWSDEILGFDCGGQQWVLEVAFPTTGDKHPSGKPKV
jgi:L-galactono-1,4-lactone dehydrogenase